MLFTKFRKKNQRDAIALILILSPIFDLLVFFALFFNQGMKPSYVSEWSYSLRGISCNCKIILCCSFFLYCYNLLISFTGIILLNMVLENFPIYFVSKLFNEIMFKPFVSMRTRVFIRTCTPCVVFT